MKLFQCFLAISSAFFQDKSKFSLGRPTSAYFVKGYMTVYDWKLEEVSNESLESWDS